MLRLREEADQTQRRLKQALTQLDSSKSLLEENGQLMRGQIQANFARQAEALRQRECWLHRQVELVRADKMEVLARQEESLRKALADLQSCLNNSDCAENQLADCLDRATSLSLVPEETPFVSFRADSALLREVISQYGRVVCGYGGHFADPARPSSCLPQAVEDEDEDDKESWGSQFMAHKSLSTYLSQQQSHAVDPSAIRIPRHATNSGVVRAWLSMQSQQNAAHVASKKTEDTESFEVISPSQASTMRDWLFPERDVDFCTNMCGQQMDTSGDTSGLGLAEIENLDREVPCVVERLRQHFAQVRDSCARQWLSCEEGSELDKRSCMEAREEKELDHAELVAEVCQGRCGEPCKTFQECCQTENCCERLLDPKRPSWNQWLVDNHVLPAGQPIPQPRPQNSHGRMSYDEILSTFKEIMDTDYQEWLFANHPAVSVCSPPITSPEFHFRHGDVGDLDRWLVGECKEGSDEEKAEKMELAPTLEKKMSITPAPSEDGLDKWIVRGLKEERCMEAAYTDWLLHKVAGLSLANPGMAVSGRGEGLMSFEKWLARK